MMLPRVGIALPVDEGYTVAELSRLARAGEDAGFELVTVGEVAGTELFALLATLARDTRSAVLASAVLPAVTRPPTVAAMGFASVGSLAQRPVVAGVGASSPVVADWHGIAHTRPVQMMREYVGVLRSALAGEVVHHEGPSTAMHGFRLAHPPAAVPVFLAAVGPKMLRLAGEIGDGAFLSLVPPASLPSRAATLGRGLEAAGRDRSDFHVVATAIPTHVAEGRGDDVRERFRRYLLPYAMVSSHRPAFEGFVPGLDEVVELWGDGRRREALAGFDGSVVDQFCALGGAGAVVERCVEYLDAGADTVVLNVTGSERGDLAGAEATIRRVGEEVERRLGEGAGRTAVG